MAIAIVDTGCANLASVKFAFDRLGADSLVTQDPDQIYGADRVIIPGVGSALYAMDKLRQRELIPVLQNLIQPVMGICLGMQLIFDRSAEGDIECLGMCDGNVEPLQTNGLTSPHMGWNTLDNLQEDPLLDGVINGDYAYFVHSYAAPLSEKTLASATYGETFSAIVRQANVYGCQFHPERSAKTGAKILENFLKVGA